MLNVTVSICCDPDAMVRSRSNFATNSLTWLSSGGGGATRMSEMQRDFPFDSTSRATRSSAVLESCKPCLYRWINFSSNAQRVSIPSLATDCQRHDSILEIKSCLPYKAEKQLFPTNPLRLAVLLQWPLQTIPCVFYCTASRVYAGNISWSLVQYE